MTDSAPSLAARLEQAATDYAVYEAAQLGDILWMTSSLAEVDVDAELRAQWTQRIERLDTRIQMRLGELATACAAAQASPSEETLAAINRAFEQQAALWGDIEEAETLLAQDVPQILDSEWRPFPPHLDAARAERHKGLPSSPR